MAAQSLKTQRTRNIFLVDVYKRQLQDLYRILQCQKENLAKDIVLASEIFTKGSLNTFAQPTHVRLDLSLIHI